MTLTSVSRSPSIERGSVPKGSFEELSEASAGAAEEEELDEVVGGVVLEVSRRLGDEVIEGSSGASSGAKITPPGGIFSLLYRQPGTKVCAGVLSPLRSLRPCLHLAQDQCTPRGHEEIALKFVRMSCIMLKQRFQGYTAERAVLDKDVPGTLPRNSPCSGHLLSPSHLRAVSEDTVKLKVMSQVRLRLGKPRAS